jgi:hypothetical protein
VDASSDSRPTTSSSVFDVDLAPDIEFPITDPELYWENIPNNNTEEGWGVRGKVGGTSWWFAWVIYNTITKKVYVTFQQRHTEVTEEGPFDTEREAMQHIHNMLLFNPERFT